MDIDGHWQTVLWNSRMLVNFFHRSRRSWRAPEDSRGEVRPSCLGCGSSLSFAIHHQYWMKHDETPEEREVSPPSLFEVGVHCWVKHSLSLSTCFFSVFSSRERSVPKHQGQISWQTITVTLEILEQVLRALHCAAPRSYIFGEGLKVLEETAQDGAGWPVCIYFSWGEAWLHRPRPPSHVSEVSKKRFLMLHLNSFDIIQFCYQSEGLRKSSGTAWTALGIVQFD